MHGDDGNAPREVACPVQAKCGGCPLMPLTADAQRDAKLARVRQALAPYTPPIRWFASAGLGYRRRIRLRVDEQGRVGFFNRAKEDGCVVLTDALTAAVNEVSQVAFVGASHLEVRTRDADGRAGLFVAPADGATLDASRLRRRLPGFQVAVGSSERAWQRFAVIGDVWSYVPLDAFVQVNAQTNRELVGALVEGARRRGAHSFYDPYAGAGNHALALAAGAMTGVAGDRHADAIAALEAAANEQQLAITAVAGAASETLEHAGCPDLIVANPPRAGLKGAAASLAALRAPHVALITCTVRALVNDLAVFVAAGYRLDELVAFDMFPHTEHVETLSWLRREPVTA